MFAMHQSNQINVYLRIKLGSRISPPIFKGDLAKALISIMIILLFVTSNLLLVTYFSHFAKRFGSKTLARATKTYPDSFFKYIYLVNRYRIFVKTVLN